MRSLLLIGMLGLVACHPRAPRTSPPLREGTTIAVYDTFAVVDDRRAVDLQGGSLVLDKIDPGASLASLTIESDLTVGACRREMAVAGAVRCEVSGAPGHHVVRVLYVSTALHYTAEHFITVAGDRAHVVSRFAISTPAWGARAELVLFDGAPGGDHAPREVARGAAVLDGTTAVLTSADRDAPATVRRVYDGAVPGDAPATDTAWGRDSQPFVWVWLELEGLTLAPGRVHVDAGGREAVVPREGIRRDHELVRMPLWVDDDLRGSRARFLDLGEGASLAERFLLGVSNQGTAPREVWIEEHLRPARHRRIERAWAGRPIATGDVVREKLVVKPGVFERTGFTIAYDF